MAKVFTQQLDAELIVALSEGETPQAFAQRKGLNLATVWGRVNQFRQTLARAEVTPEVSKKGYQLGFADPDLLAAGVPQIPFAAELGDDQGEPMPGKLRAIEEQLQLAKQRLRRLHRERLFRAPGPSDKDFGDDEGGGVERLDDHLAAARKLLARFRAQAEQRYPRPAPQPQATKQSRRRAQPARG